MNVASVFDIVVLLVVITLVIRGVARGLSGEVFSLLGTVGGIILAWKYSDALADILAGYWPQAGGAILSVSSMAAIYITSVVSAALMCKAVRAFLKFTSLAFVDRVLGALAGLLKGVALVLFLYVALSTYSPILPSEWMEKSVVMMSAHAAWPAIQNRLREWNVFPEDFSLPELDLPSLFGAGKEEGA
ncbi:MAG: CvpA family protein [Synergistaceae bacterium]|nr:CvpA family protein [Synergistaceae bacterium]